LTRALVLVALVFLTVVAVLLWPSDPAPPMAGPGYLPAEAPLVPPPTPPPRDGAVAVDFATLAGFDYDPEAGVVPDEVAALDGQQVELPGVMYYGVVEPGHVTEFYLMPNHLVCCFGTPRPNDTVEVTLPAGEATRYVLQYYLVRGRLAVEPVYDAQGNLLALYSIPDAAVEILE
jgi:hypothetical protein